MDRIAGMPPFSPYYPAPPARYRNLRTQIVRFRTDPGAVGRLLPEFLDPAPDGECAALGIDAPWSSHYGAFQAAVLLVKSTYEAAQGYFAVVQYVNSKSSISAGREIWGTPKVWADMRSRFDERVMATDAMVGGALAMSVRSTLHRACEPGDLPALTPSWRLKVIPRADGPGVEVMQLIDGGTVQQDTLIHAARAGDGVVEFRPTPVFDLSSLAPREYLGAYYVEQDHSEAYGRIVRDFVKEPWEPGG